MSVILLARKPSTYRRVASPPDPVYVPGGTVIAPSDERLLVSDYQQIAERSPTRLRFVRSIVDGNNYQHCAPGARVSFETDATEIAFEVYYNGLVTRIGARNFVSTVLIDSEVHSTFTSPTGESGPSSYTHTITGLADSSKAVTLVWPYADGMDLITVTVNDGATVSAGSSRPSGVFAAAGDSITHGFSAIKTTDTWAYGLAEDLGRQLVSLGYGSRTAVATDANALIGTGADRVTYMIGYNNFAAQSNVAAFQAQVEGWIANARAALPAAKLYIISPIYSPNTNTIPLSSYRTAVQAAEAAAGDAETYFVDGLSLMSNSNDRLADGVHPNDTGAAEIRSAMAGIIAP